MSNNRVADQFSSAQRNGVDKVAEFDTASSGEMTPEKRPPAVAKPALILVAGLTVGVLLGCWIKRK